MTKSRFFARSICLLLALCFLLSFLALGNTFVGALDAESADFGEPDGENNIKVAPSDVLEKLFADTVSAQEKLYADTYFEDILIYGASVTAENVSVSITDGTLRVTASEKVYTAANGAEVRWVPSGITYAGQASKPDENGEAFFVLAEHDRVSVTYTASLCLPRAYAERLANFAYSDAQSAKELKERHSASLEEYLRAYERYRDYLAALDTYELDMQRYGEYLEQKQIYDARAKEYAAYLTVLAAYNSDLDVYNKYLSAYQAYLDGKAKYEQAYSENMELYDSYRAYLTNLAKIRTATAPLESLYVVPSNNVGTLFNALQNAEIVGMIERHQEALITLYGVKRADIVDMRTTSDDLNELLHGYNDARAISEAEAFAYYKKHYSEISRMFNYLYEKMTAILNETIFTHVCALLESVEYKNDPEMAEYKKWRIKNVLCHIYLVCKALDDSSTLGSTWQFYHEGQKGLHEYNFTDLLGQNVIISDTDTASPASLEWIPDSFDMSELPMPPTKPAEVAKPTPPSEIAKPTPPTEIAKPTEPTKVERPSTPPAIENYDLVFRTEEHLDGITLTKRTLPDSLDISFNQTVERPFSTDGSPLVIYYGHDGSLLSTDTEPTPPEREPSAEYTYSFIEWKQRNSYADTLYFASYSSTVRKYTATFKYSENDTDTLFSVECSYGEVPVYGGKTPTRESSATDNYTFAGWYPSLAPIKADTVYIAQFNDSKRLYEISWDILGTLQTRLLPYGETVTAPAVRQTQYIDGNLYEFEGWSKSPTSVTESTRYTAQFKVTPLVSLPSDGDIKLYFDGSNYVLETKSPTADISGLLSKARKTSSGIVIINDGISLRLDSEAATSLNKYGAERLTLTKTALGVGYVFYDSADKSVRFTGKATLTLSHSLGSVSPLYIEYVSDTGAIGYLGCSATENTVEFEALPSRLYSVHKYYSVTLAEHSGGAVFLDSNLFRAGDRVSFDLLPNAEYFVSALTLTDSKGTVTSLDGKSDFIMPEDNLILTAKFEQRVYTIRFMDGDTLLSEATYLLGETVEVPEIPLTYEKDGFFYSFIGWSEPINVVTSDATYTAKYVSVRMTEKPETPPLTATEHVVKDQVIPAVIWTAAIITASVSVVLVTVFAVKRIKRKKGISDGNQEEGKDNE